MAAPAPTMTPTALAWLVVVTMAMLAVSKKLHSKREADSFLVQLTVFTIVAPCSE